MLRVSCQRGSSGISRTKACHSPSAGAPPALPLGHSEGQRSPKWSLVLPEAEVRFGRCTTPYRGKTNHHRECSALKQHTLLSQGARGQESGLRLAGRLALGLTEWQSGRWLGVVLSGGAGRTRPLGQSLGLPVECSLLSAPGGCPGILALGPCRGFLQRGRFHGSLQRTALTPGRARSL